MRLILAAAVLGATVLLTASGAFAAEEHQDPTIYMDRQVSSGAPLVSATGTARNPMDIYQELGQNDRGNN